MTDVYKLRCLPVETMKVWVAEMFIDSVKCGSGATIKKGDEVATVIKARDGTAVGGRQVVGVVENIVQPVPGLTLVRIDLDEKTRIMGSPDTVYPIPWRTE